MITIAQQMAHGPQGHRRRLRGLIACWGMVVLSALNAPAESPVSGGAPANGSRPEMSQPRGGTPNAVSTSIGQAVAVPPEGVLAAANPQQVELADLELASTALKREQLTYLLRCALPENVEVYTQQGAERFTFAGQIGLAPRWVSEALTPSEERWVSACLLAHVNAFGKHVMLSLRAQQPPVPALQASAEEQQGFPIFEGGFFGNLFAPMPVAYACRGERTPAQAQDPVLQDRVCTHETGNHTADGQPLSDCHFIVTGRCEEDSSFTVDGQPYAEVIFTYLRPHHQQ